jgi:hypothetical protein
MLLPIAICRKRTGTLIQKVAKPSAEASYPMNRAA